MCLLIAALPFAQPGKAVRHALPTSPSPGLRASCTDSCLRTPPPPPPHASRHARVAFLRFVSSRESKNGHAQTRRRRLRARVLRLRGVRVGAAARVRRVGNRWTRRKQRRPHIGRRQPGTSALPFFSDRHYFTVGHAEAMTKRMKITESARPSLLPLFFATVFFCLLSCRLADHRTSPP